MTDKEMKIAIAILGPLVLVGIILIPLCLCGKIPKDYWGGVAVYDLVVFVFAGVIGFGRMVG